MKEAKVLQMFPDKSPGYIDLTRAAYARGAASRAVAAMGGVLLHALVLGLIAAGLETSAMVLIAFLCVEALSRWRVAHHEVGQLKDLP